MIISWLVSFIVCLLIGFIINRIFPSDNRWFMSLRRPRWLTFEKWIPLIWISIFICAITSASLLWQSRSISTNIFSYLIGYGLLEMIVLAYTPVLTRFRNIRLGATVGAIGFLWGLVLTIQVWQLSKLSGLFLLPYLIWSPIGTYVTWVMARLNPPEI